MMSMKKLLLAAAAACSLLVATPRATAQVVVFDPASFEQQVFALVEAIEQTILILRQLESSDLSLTVDLARRLRRLQDVLDQSGLIVFDEVESVEQYRDLHPETFEDFETLEQVTDTLSAQNENLLAAGEQSVQVQSVRAEQIAETLDSVDRALSDSESAVGQTQAIQAGNQLTGEVATSLAGLQADQLTMNRLIALEAAHRASEREAAEEILRRMADGEGNANVIFPGVIPDGWIP